MDVQVGDILVMKKEHPCGAKQWLVLRSGLLEKTANKADIEVDGGVNLENVETLLAAGANIIVAGSAVFSGDIEENVKGFLNIMM